MDSLSVFDIIGALFSNIWTLINTIQIPLLNCSVFVFWCGLVVLSLSVFVFRHLLGIDDGGDSD